MSSMTQSSRTSGFTYILKPKTKINLTEYIIDQNNADKQLRILLNYLRILICFSGAQSSRIMESNQQILSILTSYLGQINTKHRSYFKIRSLACITMAKIATQQNDLIRALEYVEQAIIYDQSPGSSHFLARSLLFKIYILQKIQQPSNTSIVSHQNESNRPKYCIKMDNEQDEQDDQEEEPILDQNNEVYKNEQITQLYRKFKKIKFRISSQKLEIEQRLWECRQINQLLAYQYQNIIKELSSIYPKKTQILYQKGIQISRRFLGPNHRLTQILINIKNIRNSRRKLFSTNTSSQSIRTRKSKKKPVTLQKIIEGTTSNRSMVKSTINQRTKKLLHDLSQRQNKNKNSTSYQFYKGKEEKHNKNKKYYFREKYKNKTLMSQYIDTPEMAKLDLLKKLYSDESPKNKLRAEQTLKKQANKLDKLSHKYMKQKKCEKYLKVPSRKDLVQGKIINQQQLIRRCNETQSKINNIENFNSVSQIVHSQPVTVTLSKEENKIQQKPEEIVMQPTPRIQKQQKQTPKQKDDMCQLI